MFAAAPLAGNQLAVVHDADGVGDATMHAFTRETNLSETTFVQSATREGADYRNRIFSPGVEMRFAGHPSLGTAVAVALARGEDRARYVQQTIAGLQPVEVERTGERSASASMLQEPAELLGGRDPQPFLAALGLDAGALDAELGWEMVSTGTPHLMAPLRDVDALGAIRPDEAALGRLLTDFGVVLYLCAVDPAGGTARARGLFFTTTGLREDPATGSAAGPLMAYLHDRARIDRLTVEQGVEMGRPSTLHCSIEGERVRVAGAVHLVAEGTAHLPT